MQSLTAVNPSSRSDEIPVYGRCSGATGVQLPLRGTNGSANSEIVEKRVAGVPIQRRRRIAIPICGK
jgi:hypothetical protein